MASPSDRDPWTVVLALFALGNLANGAWMLLDANGWYTGIPAAVPDFGPLNEHFVRDIGAAYLTMGVALGWAAFDPRVRVLAVGLATVFYGLHAAGHAYETVAGRVGPEHWYIDLLPIYVPALVLVWILRALGRRASNGR